MGSAWTDSSNWLTGEPCVDRWHGVVCCDETADVATYDPTTRSCDAELQCRSDVIHGNMSRARCVVVELDLTENDLTGRPDWPSLLPTLSSLVVLRHATLSTITTTQHHHQHVHLLLRLRDNDLEGELPADLLLSHPTLEVVELRGNDFEYGPAAAPLFRACRTGQLQCSGVPPESCSSFGELWRPSMEAPDVCIECAGFWSTFGVSLGVLAAFALLIAA